MAASPEVKAMFRELQARPDNKVCVDCSSRIPQWASCSYGTYMCLECSGIHRSLGVHISFVQSVTMDSWKNERFVAKMRAGGNAAFNDFLARQGVPAKVIKGAAGTTDPERVREKYHAKACALYKDKMDAVADGRSWDEPSPEPYQNLAPNAGGRGSAPSSGGGGGAFAMGGGGGAFAGGSGGSGGGGGARMQGMGGGGGKMPGRSTEDEAWNMLSDWGKSAASLASKATESVKATTSDLATNVDLNSIGNVAYERAERARQAAVDLAAAQNLDEVGGKLTQTTTEAASMFGSFLGKAVSVASEGLKDTASVVGGTAGGGGWWGQQQQQQQGGGGNRTAEELGGTSTDPEGMEVMVGEDEQGYIARRTRLQAEAKARMAAKFGGGGGGGIGSSGGGGGGGGDAAQEASRSQQSRVDRLNSSGGSGGGGGKDKWADDDGWGDDGWGESSPSPAPAPAPSPRRAPAPAPSSSAMDEQAAAVAAMSGQTSQLSSADGGKADQLKGMLSAGLITQAEYEQNLATLQRVSSTGSSASSSGGGGGGSIRAGGAGAKAAAAAADDWGDDDGWGDDSPAPAPAPAPRRASPAAAAKKKAAAVVDDDDWENW